MPDNKPPKLSLQEQLNAMETSLFAKLKAATDEHIKKLTETNAALSKDNAELREVNKMLMTRVDELLVTIKNSLPPPAPSQPTPAETEANETNPVDDEDMEDFYEELDDTLDNVLILSDSIWRHVGVDCPRVTYNLDREKPKGRAPIIKDFSMGSRKITKVVIPGAQVDRLWHEAVRLANEGLTYGEVILHCGTNYFRSRIPLAEGELDIRQCMLALAEVFPEARITYSKTLPRFDEEEEEDAFAVNSDIDKLNRNMTSFCRWNDFGVFSVESFYHDNCDRLYARDNVHLGRPGIRAFFVALHAYLNYGFKYHEK